MIGALQVTNSVRKANPFEGGQPEVPLAASRHLRVVGLASTRPAHSGF